MFSQHVIYEIGADKTRAARDQEFHSLSLHKRSRVAAPPVRGMLIVSWPVAVKYYKTITKAGVT
jgi:hypothetical protein